jgi:hypothetical protein
MMASEPIAAGAPVAVSADGEHVEAHDTKHPILVAGEDIPPGAEVAIGEDGRAFVVGVDMASGAHDATAVFAVTDGGKATHVRTFLDLPDGLHENVPPALYYERIPGVANKSALDKIHRSPATYQAWVTGADEEDNEALAFGRAFHTATLEPKVFASTYTVEPDFGDCRKTDNKRTRDMWRAENARKTFLSPKDMATILGMRDAVRAHPIAGELLTGGVAEVTAKWTDPETGLTCKARVDYLRRDLQTLVDLKSTQDARPLAFAKSCANYGYHRQAAFYVDGCNEAAGAEVADTFVFVAVEKTAPYLVALLEIDEDGISKGRESIRADLHTFKECIENDTWPGYPAEVQTISLPHWAA